MIRTATAKSPLCQADSLDGHEHSEDVAEFVGVCVRGHRRRGMVCGACSRHRLRGPVAVRCSECPDDDPRPRVLIPAGMWDEAETRWSAIEGADD